LKPVAAKLTDFRLPLKHPVLYLHWLSSHRSKTVFFGIFVCSQSGNPSIGRQRKSDDHWLEDLAKYGYKPEIKYKSLITLLYVWLHNENQIYESNDFYYFFFSVLATENLQNHFFPHTVYFNFNFTF
jgi:hypothetical protein